MLVHCLCKFTVYDNVSIKMNIHLVQLLNSIINVQDLLILFKQTHLFTIFFHPMPSLHAISYTLHPTPCTLHPTPYTLHPAPYTLHPTPYL